MSQYFTPNEKFSDLFKRIRNCVTLEEWNDLLNEVCNLREKRQIPKDYEQYLKEELRIRLAIIGLK